MNVTTALKAGNVTRATQFKRQLEDRQVRAVWCGVLARTCVTLELAECYICVAG